jgi:WD40 repeat protein
MTTTEDRLREATRAAAGTVAPGSAPPLALPDPPRRAAGRLPAAPRRWAGWLTPLAAAASVVAVVAGSLAAGQLLSGAAHQRSGRRPGDGTSSTTALPTEVALPTQVPKYFVGLVGGVMDQQRRAVVAATATGKTLATVIPPKPFGAFDWVSAAADDRTFVLAAQRWVPIWQRAPVTFFRLVLTASGQPEKLRELPIRPERGISGIALSPDGTKLAVAVRGGGTFGPKIEVFSTATGSERQWIWPGSGWIGLNKPEGQPLSWAANGRTLAFQLATGAGTEVRLLDTAKASGYLVPSRRVLIYPPSGRTGWINGNALLTPDGSLVVAPIAKSHGNSNRLVTDLAITEFSATTGRPVRAVDQWASSAIESIQQAVVQDVLWTGAGGRVMIVVSLLRHSGARTLTSAIGVQIGRRFEPLPAGVQNFRSVGSPTEIAW